MLAGVPNEPAEGCREEGVKEKEDGDNCMFQIQRDKIK